MERPIRQFQHLGTGIVALAIICNVLCSSAGPGASAQTTRTIRLVVPFPPGGPSDTLARLLAEQIGRAQGLTMVVDNRPGGGSVIGTEAVSRAAPDGNTLLINSATFVINPHLRKLNYDPLTSFEPICYLVSSPTMIVVNSASPYRTLPDLIDAAHIKPGGLTLASFGPASSPQIGFEMLKRTANADITFVPYAGMAPAVNALLGEHVTSAWVDYSAAAAQVRAGTLRALATPARTRIEALPDVPTVAESGYKDFEADTWFGVAAPAKTPNQIVSELVGWFTAALRLPVIKAKLVPIGLYPVGMCGEAFGAVIRKQYDEYGRVIRESNIKAE
jgi:tripartite-type tricarboxylate transporter receptor subunit TctC